jgi:predicted metal-binding protein
MCEKCANFSERFRFDEREYLDLLAQLKRLVENETFEEVADDMPLEWALERKNWRTQYLIHHILVCTACKRRFELRFDTYRSEGVWQLLEADAKKGSGR